MFKPQRLSALALATLLASQAAPAYELYADDDSHLNADMLAVWGMFNSRKNYDGTTGGSTWREGFIKYGLSGDQGLADSASLTKVHNTRLAGVGTPSAWPRRSTTHSRSMAIASISAPRLPVRACA